MFDELELPRRPDKPRDRGLTMVIDKGMGVETIRDLVDVGGSFVDFVKFSFGTSLLYEGKLIERKLSLLRDHEINAYPGGTLFEIALLQDEVDAFLEECERVGFPYIEISDGVRAIEPKRKRDLIRRARGRGFRVLSEVGRKDPNEDQELDAAERADLIEGELEAGSWKVILESRGSGSLGLFRPDGSVREDLTETLVERLEPDDLLFEAPRKNQQVWFIRRLGPNVNLGNVPPDEVLALECLRRGLRGDTSLDFHA